MTPQLELFDYESMIDRRLQAVLLGNTCRKCANRASIRQGHDGLNRVQVCTARRSRRSKSGFLRVNCDQPACILFSHK